MFSQLKAGIQELRASKMGRRAIRAIQEGKPIEGIELLHEALQIMESSFGEIEQTIAYVWNLGQANERLGRLAEAEE